MGRPLGSKNAQPRSDKVYATRAEKNRVAGMKYRERRRTLLAELKDKPCVECGVRFHPAAMDFHHRDRSQKDLKYTAWSYVLKHDELLREVEKCDVICANCHRILHALERERAREQEVMPTREPVMVPMH